MFIKDHKKASEGNTISSYVNETDPKKWHYVCEHCLSSMHGISESIVHKDEG